jgi:uncharacterized protein (TIGR03435 family)
VPTTRERCSGLSWPIVSASSRERSLLANVLYQAAERIVIDKTGLPGWYEVELDYRPLSAPPDSPDAAALPSIFAALEEQLGLELVSERTLVPTLVIDRISRPAPD